MGAAESKNETQALASIVNDIAQQTTTNVDVGNSVYQNVEFDSCDIDADSFHLSQNAVNVLKAVQLTEALQDSTVENNIAQLLSQDAKTTMGALGVGFASASNNASTKANSTSIIKNCMYTTACILSNVNQTFTCENSTLKIKGEMNINQGSFTDIMTDQTVNNKQIVDLSNRLTQDISQTASAAVQGIAGILLLLLLLIGVVCYGLSKPLDTQAGKVLFIIGALFGLFLLLVWMASVHAPPLFTSPVLVSPYAYSGQNGKDCPDPAQIVQASLRILVLSMPPLMYLYPLFSVPSSDPRTCLLSLVCSTVMGTATIANHGYYCQYASRVNASFKELIQNQPWSEAVGDGTLKEFPELFRCCSDTLEEKYRNFSSLVITPKDCSKSEKDPKGDDKEVDWRMVLPNFEGYRDFCSQSYENAQIVRFVFSQILGFHTNYFQKMGDFISYIDDDREVQYGRVTSDTAKYAFQLKYQTSSDPTLALTGPVQVQGTFGVYPTPSYHISQFFRKAGIYVLLFLVLVFLSYIAFRQSRRPAPRQQLSSIGQRHQSKRNIKIGGGGGGGGGGLLPSSSSSSPIKRQSNQTKINTKS